MLNDLPLSSSSLSLSLPSKTHQPLLQQGDGALARGPPERREDVSRGRARDGGVPGGAMPCFFLSRERLSAGEAEKTLRTFFRPSFPLPPQKTKKLEKQAEAAGF